MRIAQATSNGAASTPAPADEEGPLGSILACCSLISAATLVKGLSGAVAPAYMLSRTLGPASASPENVALCGAALALTWLYAAWLTALKDAAAHQRLGSDTYSRLALGVSGFSALLIVMVLRFTEVLPAANRALLLGIVCVAHGLIVALGAKLYAIGHDGRSPLDDAGKIFKSALDDIIGCFKIPANPFSALYSLQAITSLVVFLWLFPTSVTPLFPGGLDSTGVYLTRTTAAGAWLTGITAFTLKDASDRGRLGASTFQLLNLALAATLAQQAWYFYSLQGAGVALAEPLWKGIVGQAAVGAAICDVAWLKAKKNT